MRPANATLTIALAALSITAAARAAETDALTSASMSAVAGRSSVPDWVLVQPPNEGCVHASNRTRQRYAEDFFLPSGEDQRLNRLVVTGVYEFSNEPPQEDAFDLQVYGQWFGSDLPDMRHAPICTLTDLTPFFRVPTGRIVNGLEVYELTYYLGDSCVMPANESYWLELVDADGVRGDSFAWECGQLDRAHGMPGSAVSVPAGEQPWYPSQADYSILLDGADASGPAAITGRVRGAAGTLARCINTRSAQQLDIVLDEHEKTTWDCTAAGLQVSRDDVVVQLLFAVVTTPNDIVGAATGEQGERVHCINTQSGQVVEPPLGTESDWDCTSAGFLAQAGDLMIHARVGVVD